MKDGKPTSFDDLDSITMFRNSDGTWWGNYNDTNGICFVFNSGKDTPDEMFEKICTALLRNAGVPSDASPAAEMVALRPDSTESQSPSPPPAANRPRRRQRKP